MKKRLLSLLLVVALVTSLVTTAFAAETPVCGVYKNGALIEEYTDLLTATEAIWNYDDVDYSEVEYTVKLYDDVELTQWQYTSANLAVGLVLDGTDLDLNGHTLTFSGKEIDASAQGACAIGTSRNDSIKNGTVIFNFGDKTSLTYGSCGLFYMLPTDSITVDSVALIADDDNKLSYGICTISYYDNAAIELKNSVIDVGGTAITFSLSEQATDVTTKVQLSSGSYKNLETSGNNRVTISGTKLETNPTGVDEGTTVITSTDTTAMIVENGNAYLYDSLQDAVDAVANGRGSTADTPATITLLKDTTEDVTIKTNTEFNISKANDDISNTGNFTTEDGYEVKTENGSVSVEPIAVTGVTLTPSTLELTVGGEAGNLTASVQPNNASQNVTWSSSNNNVATVDQNGVVTAVAEGTATITATSAVDGEKTATCSVTVKPAAIPVTKITLSEASLSLREGRTETLTATVEPENATDKTITWSSSDESVAKVDANGVVTAVSKGTATITATAGSYSASCEVTVTKKSSSSSSSASYTVSAEKAEDGKITVSPTKADKGDTVTITVKPDSGYVLDELVITDKNGKEISYKEKSETKFTFTMPGSKVTVEATFAPEQDEDKTIVLTLGSTLATVYGQPVINDVAPLARNNRTMLPIRFVAEALGARVDWDQAQQKVTITRDALIIEIFLNSDVAYVNGQPVQLDSPAFAENNRTYLPLRFVAENLGAQVDWDQPTQTVTITVD